MTVSLPAQAEWRAKVDWSAELADGHHYAAHGGRDAPFAIPSRLAPWLFDDAPLLASIRRRVPALSPLQLGDQCEDPQSDHESRILCSPVSFLLRAHGGLWVCVGRRSGRRGRSGRSRMPSSKRPSRICLATGAAGAHRVMTVAMATMAASWRRCSSRIREGGI